MGKKHKFTVEGVRYVYDEKSGNVYRVDWDPLAAIFGLIILRDIGKAKDFGTAIAMAKNDAKDQRS